MTESGEVDLWAHVDGSAPRGKPAIRIPSSGGPRARKAKLTIRAVSAQEMSPPSHQTALNWRLLSPEGRADMDGAQMILNGYRLRGQIERFFDALKHGPRIGDRQLNETNDWRKCVAFDARTAFRVWDLTWLARNRPDELALPSLQREEIEGLLLLAKSCAFKIPRGPPTLATFVVLTGGLAGFHPSKHQPLPGVKKLWEGLWDLNTSVYAVQALRNHQNESGEWNIGIAERVDYDPGDYD